MLKQLKVLVITTTLLLLSACGFQFQNGQLIPPALKTLAFESPDPYSDMARALRKQLQMNDIRLVDSASDVPLLRLNKSSSNDEVASVFKQGREAEKILILDVEASVRLPNSMVYPIHVKVNRTFFDNSRAALAKSAEKEIIWNDMREQAARQLISKMVALQHQINTEKH
ncbi:LPS-assembly lipoprotein [Mesocricetibacter intestinalis]|uniref:LPS-assembly lipoprotein LptE n=1 Tax=Mesocricetibacter intestinalis TaxID=1521930 RepID=A0A4V3D9P8_9PAST|nr:LPS assembly lipoprotein LptE [Mesocricetibacter intestinalis]TDQ58127.1 LPS-assembly lipoprotein [Mesocricetibacter intestinalis]